MSPDDILENIFRLTPAQKKALKKLGLTTVRDLLYHFPSRYSDLSAIKNIGELSTGEMATIYGRIKSLKTGKAFRKKFPLGEARLEDQTGEIKIVWFNQPYLAKMFQPGNSVKVTGKVTLGKNGPYLANPEIEKAGEVGGNVHDSLFKNGASPLEALSFVPVYPETRGITSRWFHHAVDKVLKSGVVDKIADPFPREILARYSLPELKTALIWIHTPKKLDHEKAARKRFAFEEVFFIQLARGRDRAIASREKSYKLAPAEKDHAQFLKRFPFALTGAQKKAVEDILSDFESGHPMSRLLEGDVGSGKTAVAAIVAYITATARPNGQNFGNLQVAYMAPTEILAEQHFQSFCGLLSGLGLSIGLLTGSGAKKFPSKVNPNGATDISRPQLLRWAANGEIPVLIGTHAILEKRVTFKHLALVIIDEQHRFGIDQRLKLARKQGFMPHLLSMTATPIPRTLALTIYGDLDLSLIDEMPAGRKQIKTEIVAPSGRARAYEKIRDELKSGRQAYIICPRINEPDPEKEMAVIAKSVKAEAVRLKKEIFPEYEIAALHGKLRPKEKDDIMGSFKNGEIDILVATSVVEVGVNVENATVILIEGAERFGLAQLHQLRGRVLRSTHQPYCFVFTESKSEPTIKRLKALVTAKNGFELSELDLSLRGAGELSGKKQWGLSDLGMEAIKNIKMVEAARKEALEIVGKDIELKNYPLLKERLETQTKQIHFE